MPTMQTDAVMNDSAPGYRPSSVDYNLTLLWHRCWLDGLPAHLDISVPYSEQYLFNAIPDTNHNANPTKY